MFTGDIGLEQSLVEANLDTTISDYLKKSGKTFLKLRQILV